MMGRNAAAEGIHATGLLPRLGLMTATMIVMGNMVGSGVFKKAAPMAAELQAPGLVLGAWLVGGLISLMGALSIAEVAGVIADPGGQYTFFKKTYGRLFAYIYGWGGFAVILSASTASIAYICGESANALFHFPRLSPEWESVSLFGLFYPFHNIGVKLFTVGTLGFLSVANYLGVVFGGMIANVSMTLKLAGIAIITVLGLLWSDGSFANLTPILANPEAQYPSQLGLFGAAFAALLGAFWAFDGWINITFLGGEIRNPHRNIPLSLGIGVTGVIAVYLLVNAAYLHVMPVAEMAAVSKTTNGIVGIEVMRKAFGDGSAKFVALLIFLSTFGAANCSLLSASRMYFVMARDRLFFQSAATCHPRHHTPSVSLLIQGVWISLLVFSGSFDQLSDMVIFASFIFYGAGAFGVFVLRRTMPDAPRIYRVHGYPILPAVYVLFCAVLVVVTIIERPRDAGIGLFLILAGLPLYWYWNRKAPGTVPAPEGASHD